MNSGAQFSNVWIFLGLILLPQKMEEARGPPRLLFRQLISRQDVQSALNHRGWVGFVSLFLSKNPFNGLFSEFNIQIITSFKEKIKYSTDGPYLIP